MEEIKMNFDEQQRRGLQEYIFNLEEIKDKAEELTMAHEMLERSQDLLLTVLSCTLHGLCLMEHHRFVWCNQALMEIFGWDQEELIGQSLEVLCASGEEYEEISTAVDTVLRRGGLINQEYALVHKDGHRVPCLVTGRALDRKDLSRGYVFSITDFTERNRAQAALKTAYDELEQRSTELLRTNDQLNREIEERKSAEEKLNKYRERLEELVEARTIQLTAVLDSLTKTNQQLSSEIAARQEVEQALRKSENEYRAIFENTGTATVILEEDATISLANAEYEKLSGYSRQEVEGRMKWTEFVVEEDLESMKGHHRRRRIDQDAAPRHYEFRFKQGTGNIRHIFLTVAMIPGSKRSVASLLDITDQKRMETEVLKAQKLESLGILAGGLAHDFNNILTGIIGNLSLAKMLAQPGDRILKKLEQTEKASLRAKDLTQQLLTFSKGGEPVKRILSISELIKDCAAFALRGSNVELRLSLPEGLWSVVVDEGQIGQVINNLIINAHQAMPEGGTVELEADNVAVGSSPALPLEPGRYVRVELRDQGMGIAREHIGKIFDPYFTTKQKGSGLGLAMVYSIVRRHGGHIGVDSEVGVGTRFQIYLPASTREAQETADRQSGPVAGKGKVLVMDDDLMVQEVLGEMLDYLGYEAAFAGDGAEAIELYQASKSSGRLFDVVIMDLTVPGGMGGKEAIRRLLAIDPQVKAIVSSGYSNDPVMADHERYGFVGVVSKPYRIEQISQLLHKFIPSTVAM